MPIPTEQLEKPTVHQPEQSQLASFRRVLKNRHFLLLWMAQLISLSVLNAANFGVIVLVNDLTHSVFMAGLAIIAFTLPAVPFSAVAGVVVDRLDKRLVLWVSNILRMATMLLLVVSLLANNTNLWPLYVLTFVTSLIGQFFIPAEGSSIPLLVGERELMPALSLFNISMTLSQAIGFLLLGRLAAMLFPPFTLHLGSLTLAVQSIDMLFVVVAFFYLVCTGLILCIPASAFKENHIHTSNNKGVYMGVKKTWEMLWHDMMEGWNVVRCDRLLFFSVIQLSLVGVIMLLIGELAGAFVQQVLHRPAADMSIILAPAGVGLVGASVLMPRISERIDKLRLTTIGFIVLAVGFVLLPASQWLTLHLDPQHGAQSPQLLWTTIILVLLLGAAMAAVNIPTQTMMQERAPEASRARVLALQFMLYNTGSIPVLLFAGAIAQLVGFNQLIVLLSASLLLFCWWGARYVRDYKEADNGK
jgi:MFS family permease